MVGDERGSIACCLLPAALIFRRIVDEPGQICWRPYCDADVTNVDTLLAVCPWIPGPPLAWGDESHQVSFYKFVHHA